MSHARNLLLALAALATTASPISAQIMDLQIFGTMDHCKTSLTTSELGRKDSILKKGEYLNLVNKYLSEIYSGSVLTHTPFPQLPAKMGILFDQELAVGGEIDIYGARPLQDLTEEQAEHLRHVCTRTVEGLGEYMSVIDSGFSPATLQQEPEEEEEGGPPEGANGNGEEGEGPPEGADGGDGPPEGAGEEAGGPPCLFQFNLDLRIDYLEAEFLACDSAEQEQSISDTMVDTLQSYADTEGFDLVLTYNPDLFWDVREGQEVNTLEPDFLRRTLVQRDLQLSTTTCSERQESESCNPEETSYCRWGCLSAEVGCRFISDDTFDEMEKAVTDAMRVAAEDIECLGIPEELEVKMRVEDLSAGGPVGFGPDEENPGEGGPIDDLDDFNGPTTQQANTTGGSGGPGAPLPQNITDGGPGDGTGPAEGAGDGGPNSGQGNSSLPDSMPPQNATGIPEQNNATGGSEVPVPEQNATGDPEDSMSGQNATDASVPSQSNTSDTSEGDSIPDQNTTTESVPIPSQNITGGLDQNMTGNLEDPTLDQNATETPFPGQNNTDEPLGPTPGQNNTGEPLEPIPGQNNTDESSGSLQNNTDEFIPGQNSTIDSNLGQNSTDGQNVTGVGDFEVVDGQESNTTESNDTAVPIGEPMSKSVTATSGFIVSTDGAALSDSDLETLATAFSDFLGALTAENSANSTTRKRLLLRRQRRRLYSVDEDSVNIFGVDDAACPEPSDSRMLQELNISATSNTTDPPPESLPETSIPTENITDTPNTTAAPLSEENADEDLEESLTGSNTTATPVSASNATTPPTTESDTTTPAAAGSNSTPSSDAVCQKISVSYEVVLEDGEDPETVLEEIIAATTAGIDDGRLQESIVNVDPDSPVTVEESTVPPPAPTEPPVATGVPAGLGNTTAAPTETIEKETKDDEKSSSMMPIIIAVVVGVLVLCGCAGGGYWFMQQKKVSEDTAGDEKAFNDEDEDPEKGEAADGDNDGEGSNKNDETFEHSDENDGEEGFVHATEAAFDDEDQPNFEANFGEQEAPPVEEPAVVAEELFEDEPEETAKDPELDGDDLDEEAAADGEENEEGSDDENDESDEESEKAESQTDEPESRDADAADPPEEMFHPDPDGETPEAKEPTADENDLEEQEEGDQEDLEAVEAGKGSFDTQDENEEGWDTEEGDDHSSAVDDGDIDEAGESSHADDDGARSEPSEVDSDGVDWDAEEEGGEDNGDEGSDFGDDDDVGDSDFDEDGNNADEGFDESEPDDTSFDDNEEDLQ